MRRRSHASELHNEEEEGELNLTPYLDIITTLVIFMVFTFQVVIEFRLIDLIAPALGDSTAGNDQDEKPQVQLTLAITDEGYRLMTDAEVGDDIPKKDGKYDTAELKRLAVQYKEKLELGESITLTAGSNIEYATVIEAMDAIRVNGKQWLFPDVMFGQVSVGGGG